MESRRSQPNRRWHPGELFELGSDRPTWSDVPREAQRTVIKLLARMLRSGRAWKTTLRVAVVDDE
jgi:hypothetical protein